MKCVSIVKKLSIGAIFSSLLCCSLHAQTTLPHTFSNGSPADADKVNENFDALLNGIQVLERYQQMSSTGAYDAEVDCTEDSNQFYEKFQETRHVGIVRFQVTGACVWPDARLAVEGRTIQINGNFEDGACGSSSVQLVGPSPRVDQVGGLMVLNCIKLDSSDGSPVSLSVYDSGHISANALIGGNGGLRGYAWRQGYLLVQSPDESMSYFSAGSLGYIRLHGGITDSVIVLRNGSTLFCQYCSGNIEELWAASLSQIVFYWPVPSVVDFMTVQKLSLFGNSKAVVEKRSETSLDVVIENEVIDESSSVTKFVSVSPPPAN